MQQPGLPSLPQAGLPTHQPLPTGGAASLLAQQQQLYQSMMMSQAANMTPQMLSMMGNLPYSPLMVPGMMPFSSVMHSQSMAFPVPGVRPNLTLMPELLSLLNLTQVDSSMQAAPPSGEKGKDPKS